MGFSKVLVKWLDWKKLWIAPIAWVVAVVLHNVVYGLIGIEEAFFFIVAIFVIPIYVLVVLGYTIYVVVKKNVVVKKKLSARKHKR